MMPTFVSHAVSGLTVGYACAPAKTQKRVYVALALGAILPDLDALGLRLGIPYEHFFGHRGFFHSLVFAVVLAVTATYLISFSKTASPINRWRLCWVFSLAFALHPALDAMTNGGLGVALLSPFDNTRYFFPWTPIQVAPISPRAFFSAHGGRALLSEMLWIWLPAVVWILSVAWLRKRRTGRFIP